MLHDLSVGLLLFSISRWPPLTTQANYGSVLMAAKDPPTLLAPTQGSQPAIAELETGQLTQNAQSREVSTPGRFCINLKFRYSYV